LKPNISTDSLKLPGYKPPYRRDRVDRLGGGVVVFVKDEINCVTRLDLHVGSVECIWLEIKINNKKYLYGTFYIPPYSGQQIWEELVEFIDLALNSNHDSIITEPTYVTERSSSLLDLVFQICSNPPICAIRKKIPRPYCLR
jgi:hypothetical protein